MRGLGATALWITPPVANQWLDPSGSYAGYHGYWAEHFMQVDRHLGTLDDYRRCRAACTGAACSWCRTSCSTTPATSSPIATAGARATRPRVGSA
jgi:hypothetical protein